MAWSKSTRIRVMLAIDVMFFLLELIVGIVVSSLALQADAFHMLNDIISLLVGLWAVSAANKATTDRFSYGWLRAEILGAFFNAVFLIALCVSIILEAFTRFIDPPTIGNPELILIVGCLGLASNLVGFLVLGGHGHSHGPGDHSHGDGEHINGDGDAHTHSHYNNLDGAEEGRAGFSNEQQAVADDSGRAYDLFPEVAVARYPSSPGPVTPTRHIRFDREGARSDQRAGSRASGRRTRTPVSARHSRLTSIDDMSIHPASFRQEIIDASRPQPDEESSSDSGRDDENATQGETDVHEDTPLLSKDGNGDATHQAHGARSAVGRPRHNSEIHHTHNHNKPKKASKGHGHNHGDMGMNAMVLHVIGDALGNVGVIATALIIWLTEWKYRFYADPAVSLFITLIILRSAVPLTVAASKILLQATPDNIDLNDVREDIQGLPGVVSCHHVHIWQLSDTKVVASLHIRVSFPLTEENGQKYMNLSMTARKCLHDYGIHSATIQPEFYQDDAINREADAALRLDGYGSTVVPAPNAGKPEEDFCLLECVDDCFGQGCCQTTGSRPESSHSAHSQSAHDHSAHDHSSHDHSTHSHS
ncbi:cation efflux protein [Bombardia bombarda]|uniref:Cation efflux protein n=1 Tax=Bombardia bombarda TaxID=252184 RepID=A0AA40C9G1_9PEZI|nr:cation efflux protein [Bombardia bombarda]